MILYGNKVWTNPACMWHYVAGFAVEWRAPGHRAIASWMADLMTKHRVLGCAILRYTELEGMVWSLSECCWHKLWKSGPVASCYWAVAFIGSVAGTPGVGGYPGPHPVPWGEVVCLCYYTTQIGFRNIRAPRKKFLLGAVMFWSQSGWCTFYPLRSSCCTQFSACPVSFVFSRLEYSKALSQEVRHQALAFGPVAKEVFGQGKFSKVQLFVRSPYFAAVCLAQWKHRGRLLQSSVHGDMVRCSDAQEAACYCKCFACDAGEPSWNLFVHCRRIWRGVYRVPWNGQIWPTDNDFHNMHKTDTQLKGCEAAHQESGGVYW